MSTDSIAAPARRTLFLQAPSFDGFDGGAGSRYQAKREVKSFWFPTWLAQPAALVENSRVVDAPADGLTVEQCLAIVAHYDLVIMHTSTPSFPTDAKFAELVKARYPAVLVGMVGAKTMVDPEGSLRQRAKGKEVLFQRPDRLVAGGEKTNATRLGDGCGKRRRRRAATEGRLNDRNRQPIENGGPAVAHPLRRE